ncbi:hypothetical protein PSPO01_12194 [Paraphaeosphaeria sporulosa]
MCTVIYYSFDCGHYITRCQSRCGGTKVKERRDSRRAACTAEGYVTIKRSFPCSKCSREAWLSHWEKRLEKARRFYNELVKEKLPGARAVSELINQLDKEYELEAWELRNTIPHGDRARIRRVTPAKARWSKLPPSPLKREVQPEEIVLPVITELVYNKDDDDWVPSADPLHPIDTNYELVDAGIDDDYLRSLLGEDPGEVAEPEQDNVAPFNTSWDWNDGVIDPTDGVEQQGLRFDNHSETSETAEPNMNQLMAWNLTAADTVSSGEIGPHELRKQEDGQQEQIKKVIKAFWDVVNITNHNGQPQSPTESTEDVSINADTSDHTNPAGLQHPWIDTPPMQLQAPQSNQDQHRPVTPIRTTSTNTKYDVFRRAIPHSKPSVEYYAQWLVECRLEIREMVGPDGAWVPDPASFKA